ncbi:hypothetical protein FACS1894166_09100 [Bacilli bacterium]|nr:hypothetical protein FACS1894166_09100 [Bacilli bacterium]
MGEYYLFDQSSSFAGCPNLTRQGIIDHIVSIQDCTKYSGNNYGFWTADADKTKLNSAGSLAFGDIPTPNATFSAATFSGFSTCSAITSIDYGAEEIEFVGGELQGCTRLRTIRTTGAITSFGTGNATPLGGCNSLTDIYMGNIDDTATVNSAKFNNCP